jgi:hypothetical protein
LRLCKCPCLALISECGQEDGVDQSCLGFHGDAGMFEEGAQLEADIVCFLGNPSTMWQQYLWLGNP